VGDLMKPNEAKDVIKQLTKGIERLSKEREN